MKHQTQKTSIKQYWPLISLMMVSIFAAFAINWRISGNMTIWMHYFMGVFLLMFSTLKIFHLEKFANGFEMYDILAKRSRAYAYIYPFVELLLGLLYLSFILPILTYVLTAVILTFGSIGVIQALKSGLDIHCPCMGSILDVPLSTVTLTEDIGMTVMALILLFMRIT